MATRLSHYDRSGKSKMVDVSGKAATRREAEASAMVVMRPAVLKALATIRKAIRWKRRGWLELWPRKKRRS